MIFGFLSGRSVHGRSGFTMVPLMISFLISSCFLLVISRLRKETVTFHYFVLVFTLKESFRAPGRAYLFD